MTSSRSSTPSPAGERLAQELVWVHGAIRRDLRTVEKLAADIEADLPATAVARSLQTLQTRGPLWQLRINCLRYCQFVHTHHGLEDAHLFPALRRADPALGPTVDRLEADHRVVSDLLDRVETLAEALTGEDGPAARGRLAGTLRELRNRLLEHLDVEEEAIIPTLRHLPSLI